MATRAHLFHHQARRDRAEPHRRRQRGHREGGSAHRGAEAHPHDPPRGRDLLRGPQGAPVLRRARRVHDLRPGRRAGARRRERRRPSYREIMGATNPESAAEGTIRKLFAKSIGENSVHGSDSPDNAKIEIAPVLLGQRDRRLTSRRRRRESSRSREGRLRSARRFPFAAPLTACHSPLLTQRIAMNRTPRIERRPSVCPHDCPSACSLDVEVIDGAHHRARARGEDQPLHGGRDLREGGALCRAHPPSRPAAPSPEAHRPEGLGRSSSASPGTRPSTSSAEKFLEAERHLRHARPCGPTTTPARWAS